MLKHHLAPALKKTAKLNILNRVYKLPKENQSDCSKTFLPFKMLFLFNIFF